MPKIGDKNAKGNKGGNGAPTVQDRELSKRVRSLTLKKIEKILMRPVVRMDKEEYDLYKQVLLKLAGNVLPRLNAGRDDDERLIPEPIMKVSKDEIQKNNSNPKNNIPKSKDKSSPRRNIGK